MSQWVLLKVILHGAPQNPTLRWQFFLQCLTILTILTISDHFGQTLQCRQFKKNHSFENSYNDNDNDNPRDLWPLRHWLQFTPETSILKNIPSVHCCQHSKTILIFQTFETATAGVNTSYVTALHSLFADKGECIINHQEAFIQSSLKGEQENSARKINILTIIIKNIATCETSQDITSFTILTLAIITR